MIIIRFKDAETEHRAIGYLVGRFAGKSFANGETIVPAAALPYLAVEGFQFTVIGPATYERLGAGQ
jgi:hypothetical protein